MRPYQKELRAHGPPQPGQMYPQTQPGAGPGSGPPPSYPGSQQIPQLQHQQPPLGPGALAAAAAGTNPKAPVPIQHRMSSNPMLTPRPGGPGGGGPGSGLGGRPQLLPQRSSSAQQPPPHPAGGFGPQVPPPAYTSGPRSLHRPKASQGGAKMMGGGPGRGAGAMIPRPLLGPHLTGSGGSVSAQSGSETDVSTSTENLTQEERFVLRHMERQEPQGEENGDLAAFAHHHGLSPRHQVPTVPGGQLPTSVNHQNLKEMLRQRNMVLNTSQAGSQVLGGPQGLQQQQQLASTTSATQQLGSAALSGQTAASANPGRVGTPNAQTATSALGSSVGSIPGAAAAVASSSQATSQLDSPIVTSALARHPLQEDLYMATRLKAVAPLLSPSVSSSHLGQGTSGVTTNPAMFPSNPPTTHPQLDNNAVNPMMSTSSKLNPSVYSHPMMAQDPVLAGGVGGAKGGPSFKSELPLHRDLAVLSGRRGNVEMTSSGAFFDPKAVSGPLAKKGSLGAQDPSSQSDIIAQLTREMKLSGISGSSDAVSSVGSGSAASQLNQLGTSSSSSMSKQIISQLQQDAANLSKMTGSNSSLAGSAAEVNSSVAASRGATSATTTSAVSQPNVVGSAALTTLTATSAISTVATAASNNMSMSSTATTSSSGYKSSLSGASGLSVSAEMLDSMQRGSLSDLSTARQSLANPHPAPSNLAAGSFNPASTKSNTSLNSSTTSVLLNNSITSNNLLHHQSSNASAINQPPSVSSSTLLNSSSAAKLQPLQSLLASEEKLQAISRSQPDLFEAPELAAAAAASSLHNQHLLLHHKSLLSPAAMTNAPPPSAIGSVVAGHVSSVNSSVSAPSVGAGGSLASVKLSAGVGAVTGGTSSLKDSGGLSNPPTAATSSLHHHSPIYANTQSATASSSSAAAAGPQSLLHQQQNAPAAGLQHPPQQPMPNRDQLEALRLENAELRSNVSEMVKKIGKVNTLEQEMAKIHQAYQALLKHSEKREALEKSARAKLQSVIVNLSEANKEVTERHEAVMAQLMSGEPKNQNIPGLDAILRGEIMRKDALINQLMNQNKMLMASKERQDIEMTAQGETLEEQRAHIQILDSALSNAQATILRLEEENRMKEGYAERVKQMTRSLEQLQAASEKREAMEKKLRAKLEEEVKELRGALAAQKLASLSGDDVLDADDPMLSGLGGRASASLVSAESLEDLRRKFSEAEEKIIRLESERTQWEQRYLEESAMRQVAIDAASIPKDAKIAALEKNSAESEKMIAEARSDKLKQFQEMQNTQRKVSELENLVKTLETSLAEREAMIRIFQTNKTVNNSNDILNKALVSGGVPGTATSSQGAAAAASGQLAAAQLSAAAAAAAAATSDPLTQAQIRSALLTSTASPIPPPVTTSSSAAVQAAVAAAAAAAAAQQATASPAMAGSLVHHHQKQLSTPLPLTSAGLSAAAAAASAAGSGHPLAGQLPHPHHAQFKSISLNSTPTRNLTSLPYSSPALQHTMSPFAQGGLHGGLHGGGPLGHVGPGAIGRSLTPSADMLLLRDSHTAGGGSVAPPSSVSASMFRSSTPGVDFFTSSGPGSRLSGLDHFKLARSSIRRESAPADVLNASSSTASSSVAATLAAAQLSAVSAAGLSSVPTSLLNATATPSMVGAGLGSGASGALAPRSTSNINPLNNSDLYPMGSSMVSTPSVLGSTSISSSQIANLRQTRNLQSAKFSTLSGGTPMSIGESSLAHTAGSSVGGARSPPPSPSPAPPPTMGRVGGVGALNASVGGLNSSVGGSSVGAGTSNNNSFNIQVDDSIGSIMMGQSHSAANKNFMEVWKV